jgi:ABC-type sugar transport system permease subunit
MTILKAGKKKIKSQRERVLLTFYISMMILPILQVAIFYVYINFNSLKMSFWEYSINPEGNGYMYVFSGFDNFKEAIQILTDKAYLIVNSLKYFAVYLFVGVPLALIFSFYIYKGYRGSKFYKVVLFLPNIISSLIFALLFKYIVTNVYSEVFSTITGESVAGLLDNNNTKMATLTFYNIWASFGVNMLMFSSAMGNIPKEVFDAGELDGMNIIQEFFLVTLPMIYPTITSIIVICTTGIFSNC